jgi:hypothetical protein
MDNKDDKLGWITWKCPLCGAKNFSTLYWFNNHQEHCDCCSEIFEVQYETKEIWHVTTPDKPPIKIYSNIKFNEQR